MKKHKTRGKIDTVSQTMAITQQQSAVKEKKTKETHTGRMAIMGYKMKI